MLNHTVHEHLLHIVPAQLEGGGATGNQLATAHDLDTDRGTAALDVNIGADVPQLVGQGLVLVALVVGVLEVADGRGAKHLGLRLSGELHAQNVQLDAVTLPGEDILADQVVQHLLAADRGQFLRPHRQGQVKLDLLRDRAVVLLHDGVAQAIDDVSVEYRVVGLVGRAVQIAGHNAHGVPGLAATQDTVTGQHGAFRRHVNHHDDAVEVILQLVIDRENLTVVRRHGVGGRRHVGLPQDLQSVLDAALVAEDTGVGHLRQTHAGLSRACVDAGDEAHAAGTVGPHIDDDTGTLLSPVFPNHCCVILSV